MPLKLDLPHFSVLSNAAIRCGIDIRQALGALDIVTSSPPAALARFSLADIARLLATLEQETRQGYFPFALADAFRFDAQPGVSAFITSSRNLRESGALFEWIPQLIHPAIRFKQIDNGQQVATAIDIVDPQGVSQDLPALVEIIAAVVRNYARSIAPELDAHDAVHFAHAPRIDAQAYLDYFRCPVQFQAARNQLVSDSWSFDQELPGNLPTAHALAAESIRVQLIGDGVAPPLPVLIRDLLRRRLELCGAGMAAVAAALKMHPRTLQRQLRKQGLSYSGLLARTRHELACEMLRTTQLDIESIGFKLGFGERRSFTSAFQSWQGQTPSAYRQNRQAAPARRGSSEPA